MTTMMKPGVVVQGSTVAAADDNDDDILLDHVNDVNDVNEDNEDPVASLLGMSDAVPPPGAAAAAATSTTTAANNNSSSMLPSSNSCIMMEPKAVEPSGRSSPSANNLPPQQAAKSPIRSHVTTHAATSSSHYNNLNITDNHQHQGSSNSGNNICRSNANEDYLSLGSDNETTATQKASTATSTSIPTTKITSPSPPLLQQLQLENTTLREKNDKLKSLLGRSAKAQRDAKHELERTKRLYESIKVENEKLGRRVEALANRPTHMDLLADFEANFDRALLSIGNEGSKSGQSGGEDAAEASSSSSPTIEDGGIGSSLSDGLLMHTTTTTAGGNAHLLLLAEIDEANSQIAHLEFINSTLQNQYDSLEKSHVTIQKERKSLTDTCAILRLELRGSKSESEKLERECRMALATVEEMRLEVDLATRAAAEANRRASYAELGMTVGGGGMGVSSTSARGSGASTGWDQSDSDYVAGLEAKVAALQEWALASAESKRLTAERCMELEERVRELEEKAMSSGGGGGEGTAFNSSSVVAFDNEGCSLSNFDLGDADDSAPGNTLGDSSSGRERKLWTKSASLVVGAGMVGHAILELGSVIVEPSETVMLRWKFDITPADLDIDFSVLKGLCEDARTRRGADACLRVRRVTGGGGGDIGGAFARQNACTMVWSNDFSWVRPRTIKWTAEAVAIAWGD
ncbi:hypothetical protein ACHAXH_006768 [Discostella pseudostelligera]